MTELGDEVREGVLEVFEEIGIEVSIQPLDESYSSATGSVAGPAPAAVTVVCSPPIDEEDTFRPGTTAREGHARVFTKTTTTSGAAYTPKKGDKLTIGDKVWTVVAVKAQRPDVVVAAYELVVR